MERMGIEVEGLKPFLSQLSKLPKTAQNEIRIAAQAIADEEASRIKSAGQGSDAQSRAAAQSVRSRKDRVPYIQAGGSTKAGVAGGATAGQLFFGAEFGGQSEKRWEIQTKAVDSVIKSGKRKGQKRTRTVFAGVKHVGSKRTTMQFRPWRGRQGYWFWPQIREDDARMLNRWADVVKAIAREWEAPGE